MRKVSNPGLEKATQVRVAKNLKVNETKAAAIVAAALKHGQHKTKKRG
jgi:hypothetical protein